MCIESGDVLDLLTSLVERSLVGFEEETGRYSVLETVRQYSRENLADSGEGEAVRERHGDHVRAFAKALPRPETLDDSMRMLSLIDQDVDNLRAAIEHYLSGGRFGEAGRILRQSHMYWIWAGKIEEVRSYYHRILESDGHKLGPGDNVSGSDGRDPELDRDVAEALLSYGSLYMFDVHSEQALPDLDLALGAWTKLGVPEKISHCHRLMGNIHLAAGRLDESERNYLKACTFHPGGKPDGALLNNLGLLEITRKNWSAARVLLEQAMEETTSHRMRLATYANLSRVAFRQGHLDETRTLILKLFEWHGETFSPFGIIPTLERVAEYALAVGRTQESATCLGSAQSLRDEYRFARSMYEEEDFDRIRSGCRAALGEDEFELRYAAGAAMSLHEAFDSARIAMG